MAIRELTIKGFRSLRDLTWNPGRLNVLIGPDGSGKSNLLRSLQLLSEAATGDLYPSVLRLGGMGALLWDGTATDLSWSVRFDPDEISRRPGSEYFNYELTLRRIGATGAFDVVRERTSDLNFDVGSRPGRTYLNREPGRIDYFDSDRNALMPHEGSLSDQEPFLEMAARWGGDANHHVWAQWKNWSVYHDLRTDPGALVRQAAVTRRDARLDADGQNLVSVLHTLYAGNRDFGEQVDRSMTAAFGSEYDGLTFPPAEDQRVNMRVRWKSLRRQMSAADLSDGTIRYLMLAAVFRNPEPGALIAIDEPETGLHPDMLVSVAEMAAAAAERTQVIISTHSADLLDALGQEDETLTVTVAENVQGETRLSVLKPEDLKPFLEHYRLGRLFRTGQLEALTP